MRKPYTAPAATFELFAPVERLSSWTWGEHKDSITDRWWIGTRNFWGAKPASNANGGEWLIGEDTIKDILDIP